MCAWLGRYTSPFPVRCRGAFHFYAARLEDSAAPRLVVASAPSADREHARASVDALAAAHRAVQGAADALPAVAESGDHDGTAFVAFDLEPAFDGEYVIALLASARVRMPYPEAIAVVERLGRAIEAAHAVTDPTSGAPCALGGLAWANVVVATDGSLHLIGLGHNVVGRDERGAPSGAPSFFAPPELSMGGPATASSDAYAFVQLQRSVLAYCELPKAIERVFRGEPEPADAPIGEIIRWSTEHALGAPPARRTSLAGLRERWEREWALLDVRPDPLALERHLRTIVATEPTAPPTPRTPSDAPAGGAVLVDADGAWLRVAGEEKRLDGRGALKRILVALVQQRLASPGVRLDPDALLEIGWPGERPIREAGMNRVYVAVSNLRKLGLRDGLQRDGEGYRIDPRLVVRFADTSD